MRKNRKNENLNSNMFKYILVRPKIKNGNTSKLAIFRADIKKHGKKARILNVSDAAYYDLLDHVFLHINKTHGLEEWVHKDDYNFWKMHDERFRF